MRGNTFPLQPSPRSLGTADCPSPEIYALLSLIPPSLFSPSSPSQPPLCVPCVPAPPPPGDFLPVLESRGAEIGLCDVTWAELQRKKKSLCGVGCAATELGRMSLSVCTCPCSTSSSTPGSRSVVERESRVLRKNQSVNGGSEGVLNLDTIPVLESCTRACIF